MKQITKTKFMWGLERGIVVWPPVVIGSRMYGLMVKIEEEKAGLVWCNV